MNRLLTSAEKALAPLFANVPSLPKNAQLWLVKAWPYLALLFGLFQLLGAWTLWQAGHRSNELLNYANEIARSYGMETAGNSLSVFYWLALIFLVVNAVILFAAYSGLAARKKEGWNLLFLGAFVNLAYGIVILFDASYGGFGSLLSALVGSAVSFYLLFQIRQYYVGKKK